MRITKISISILIIILLITGCAMPSKYVVTPVPTITPAPALTNTPTPNIMEGVPSPTTTVGPFSPFSLGLLDASVNLRLNPGVLFPVLRLLPPQSSVTVLGKTPGSEWLYVEVEDGSKGWVSVALAAAPPDLRNVPEVTPDAIQIITGVVKDAQGQPVTGVGFAAQAGEGSAGDNDPSGTTDETGTFYIFLPTEAGPTWTVSYLSVSCNSNTMDANCNCRNNACGRPDPERRTITLPDDARINFTWVVP